MFTSKDLNKLLKASKFLIDVNPVAACLMLGLATEMLCRIVIRNNRKLRLAQMLKLMKNNNVVSDNDYDNLEKIRKSYNKTKHTLHYEIDLDENRYLWSELNDIVAKVMKTINK